MGAHCPPLPPLLPNAHRTHRTPSPMPTRELARMLWWMQDIDRLRAAEEEKWSVKQSSAAAREASLAVREAEVEGELRRLAEQRDAVTRAQEQLRKLQAVRTRGRARG